MAFLLCNLVSSLSETDSNFVFSSFLKMAIDCELRNVNVVLIFEMFSRTICKLSQVSKSTNVYYFAMVSAEGRFPKNKVLKEEST